MPSKCLLNSTILLVCFGLYSVPVLSQLNKPVPLVNKPGTFSFKQADTISAIRQVPQKDLPEVIAGLFRKDRIPDTTHYAISSKPVLSIVPAIGYTLQSRLAAVISGNVAFYNNGATKISTVSGHVTYTQNKQFYFPVQSIIWTKGNKYNLVGDLRYYKYPQSSFGFGSNSTFATENPMDYSYI